MALEYTELARILFQMCRNAVGDHPHGQATAARAMSTCLAATIKRADDPGLLLALIVRDLAEATLIERPREVMHDLAKIMTSGRPNKRRARSKKVVDLATARRQRRQRDRNGFPDKEPA